MTVFLSEVILLIFSYSPPLPRYCQPNCVQDLILRSFPPDEIRRDLELRGEAGAAHVLCRRGGTLMKMKQEVGGWGCRSRGNGKRGKKKEKEVEGPGTQTECV